MNFFGKKERCLSSSKELRDVQMHIYTKPSGIIGRLIGRALKIRVDRFEYGVESGPDGEKVLRRVTVDTDSLVPVADVDERKFERLLLSLSEVERVGRRMKTVCLDTFHYPQVVFRVEKDSPDSVSGELELRSVKHPLVCTKVVEGPELVVTCPIKYTDWDVPGYTHMFGLLGVRNQVEVVTRVPMKVFSL